MTASSRLQEVLRLMKQAPAAGVPPATFTDWAFSGRLNDVLLSVTITATNPADPIVYALVVLATQQGIAICDSEVDLTAGASGTGMAELRMVSQTNLYDANANGPVVTAVAFAQVASGAPIWSPRNTYTVQV